MESNYMASNRLIDNTLFYNVYDVPNNQVVNPLNRAVESKCR
jgi:hypothetical protein